MSIALFAFSMTSVPGLEPLAATNDNADINDTGILGVVTISAVLLARKSVDLDIGPLFRCYSRNTFPLRVSSRYLANHPINLFSIFSFLSTRAHANCNYQSPSPRPHRYSHRIAIVLASLKLSSSRFYLPASSSHDVYRILDLIGLSMHPNSTPTSGLRADNSPRTFRARTGARRADS
ncbi:hypothetical protein B0H13DRAFT_2384628 [Mycena leptocephala]|nr:hypothetical protein B0H13DRAFT_2384628 [Mycena leptocephala]